MESYVRIGGRGLKNLTYHSLDGSVGGGVKKGQNHPYVINEWPVNWDFPFTEDENPEAFSHTSLVLLEN